MADLYDHPLEFYVYAFAAEGAFDTDACAAHGYNDVQVAAIQKALADNPNAVAAAMARVEAHKAAIAPAAAPEAVEELPESSEPTEA